MGVGIFYPEKEKAKIDVGKSIGEYSELERHAIHR